MAISATPEMTPSNEPPLDSTPPVDSSTNPTPPTPSPTDSHIDPAYARLLEQTIASQNKRLQDLEDARARGAEAPLPPPKSKEENRQAYYDDPVGTTQALIDASLERTIGPVRELVMQFRGQGKIDQFVERFKIDPRFKSHWSPAIEQYVREQAASIEPSKLDDRSFGFVVVSGIGLKTAGLLPGDTTPSPAPAPAPTPAPTPMAPTPPYLRPSTSSGPPASDSTPRHRPLTEDERRILNEFNASKPKDKRMTEAEYIQWQEIPSDQVARADFDKPKTR